MCATALGLIDHDEPVLGVIDLPFLGSRYWATRGDGAFRDGHPLHQNGARELDHAVVALGDYAVGAGAAEKNRLRFEIANRIASVALRVRMVGSAAIDLAWLAEGKFDASITLSNNAWDMAPGVVIAREAGADVVDIDGTDYRMTSSAVLGSSPALTGQIVALMTAGGAGSLRHSE